MKVGENVSESVRNLNPDLFKALTRSSGVMLRQSSKDLLNKLETEFKERLRQECPDIWMTEQAITFRLANGVRYTPDFMTFSALHWTLTAYEVKGFMRDDAGVKLKVAAQTYPWIKWVLVWKTKSHWKEQVIVS